MQRSSHPAPAYDTHRPRSLYPLPSLPSLLPLSRFPSTAFRAINHRGHYMIANIVKIIKQCARHPATIMNTVERNACRNTTRAGWGERGEVAVHASIAENRFGKSRNKQVDWKSTRVASRPMKKEARTFVRSWYNSALLGAPFNWIYQCLLSVRKLAR